MAVVAAVQMKAIPMDPEASLRRIEEWTEQACSQGARLVAFPELLVPGYPRYIADPFPVTEEGGRAWSESQRYWKAYVEHSQVVPGPFTDALGEIARAAGATLVVGISEKDPDRRACLWNTAVVIGADGTYLGRHRKLVAVMHERMYFQRGGREDIRTFDADIGRVGVAICFENYHPLFRRSLGALGEEIHCALWTGPAPVEVAASGKALEWHRELGTAHALDTGSWVVISSQVTDREPSREKFGSHWAHSGGSYIVNPLGETVAGVPDYEEGIALAEADLSMIDLGRLIWNPFGDDERTDLFPGGASVAPRLASEEQALAAADEAGAPATAGEDSLDAATGAPRAGAQDSSEANGSNTRRRET